jgi:hypothetical protein
MSIENLARQHANRLEGSNSIAAMCLDRINKGEPRIAAGFIMDDRCRNDDLKIEYLTPDGEPTTQTNAARLMNTSRSNCKLAFTEYDHKGHEFIYSRFGKNKFKWQEYYSK